jgi:hypothetical protein
VGLLLVIETATRRIPHGRRDQLSLASIIRKQFLGALSSSCDTFFGGITYREEAYYADFARNA